MDWQSAPASDRFKFGDVVATVGLFNGRVKAGLKVEVTNARASAGLVHSDCPVLILKNVLGVLMAASLMSFSS